MAGYKKTEAGGQLSCFRLCLDKLQSSAFRIEMCQQLALLILNNLIVLQKTTLGDKSCFSSCETQEKKITLLTEIWSAVEVY